MHSNIFSFFILFFCLSACNGRKAEIPISKNDTTLVIEFAIRKAFYHHNLPGDGQLTKKYYFKDSILFTADSLPLKYLPLAVDSVSFKILSKDQIVRLITADSIGHTQPNYLCISNFKKQDSIYYLNVISTTCIPYRGGGVFGIEILKRGDSLIVVHQGVSNIN